MNKADLKTRQPIEERTKWRDDFPVDEAEDRYVSRREFTKFLVLISGGFTLGQLWIGLLNLLRGRRKPIPQQEIGRLDEIPVGGFLAFHYPTMHERCLLIRTSETELVAYSDKCTHLMCPVVPKVEEGHLYCPCHQGFFDINNGRPFAGPPQRPLARVEIKIENGLVYATGVEVPKR